MEEYLPSLNGTPGPLVPADTTPCYLCGCLPQEHGPGGQGCLSYASKGPSVLEAVQILNHHAGPPILTADQWRAALEGQIPVDAPAARWGNEIGRCLVQHGIIVGYLGQAMRVPVIESPAN